MAWQYLDGFLCQVLQTALGWAEVNEVVALDSCHCSASFVDITFGKMLKLPFGMEQGLKSSSNLCSLRLV